MSMKISIDPVISSRIKAAWAKLTPAQQAEIRPAMQRADDQVAQVVRTRKAPAAAAAPHALTLANTALTADSSQVVSQLEAGVVVDVGPDGVIWGTGKWEQLDPGWAESFAIYLESLVGGKNPWVASPQTITIPNQVRIAIAGDWGTGDWRTPPNLGASTRVGQQIADLKPDVTIHLGDVYYAGTSDQELHLLTLLWPTGPSGSFTLNSNHEMYSGAKPYFAAINAPPFDKQGGCSYFALENDNWVIVALDTAYYSPDSSLYMDGLLYPVGATSNDQSAFLQQKAQEARASGKRLILFSHHNGLNDTGTATNPLFDQVVAALPPGGPVYWYYGHEHMAVVYMPQGAAGLLCRCCGHGALPWGQSSDLASGANVVWYENRNAGDPDIPQRVLNGFAMLTLSGPNIQETFYDENGGVAWAST